MTDMKVKDAMIIFLPGHISMPRQQACCLSLVGILT